MKTCVIIPAYNESKQVGDVVSSIKKKGFDILVIDDGSSDDTAKIASNAGAKVLKNSVNKGKGAVLREGFDYAIRNSFDAVIAMDGDGQHHPDEIDIFISETNDNCVGMVVGNRMKSSKDMPAIRWFTNKLTSRIISWACGQRVPDSQCGFRLIKTDALKKINLQCCRYEIESELIIKISRAGYKIKSVPIQTIYQKAPSKINPFVDTFRFLRFILKEL